MEKKQNKYKTYLAVTLIMNAVLAAAMPKLCYMAYVERGCEWAYGGEWLILWFGVLAVAYMLFDERE